MLHWYPHNTIWIFFKLALTVMFNFKLHCQTNFCEFFLSRGFRCVRFQSVHAQKELFFISLQRYGRLEEDNVFIVI